MPKISSTFAIPAALLALGLIPVPAQAQLARTFVSSAGSDANDCNRFTPCRTFQRAHDNTLANGAITVLDPGGYGAVFLLKSISITNDGVGEAGVLVSGAVNGITINAAPGDAINLRGLTIKGIGFGGGNGIVFNSGRSVTVENCAIRNLTGTDLSISGIGFLFRPDASASTNSRLAMSSTVIADNQSDGIIIQPRGTGTVTATLNRVELYSNNVAVDVEPFNNLVSTRITVTDSVVAGNFAGFDVGVPGGAGATSSLTVIRSVVADNTLGLVAHGVNAALRIGLSAVAGNGTTWSTDGGALLQSFGDNYIAGNGDNDPAPPTIARK